MSSATVSSCCLVGYALVPIQVEVDIQPGLPILSIIGLPDRRIAEAGERVRAAVKNSGFKFPLGKITVNLSPSALPKQGTGLDLAIALGILVAAKLCKEVPEDCWVAGELGLDGSIRKFEGLMGVMAHLVENGAISLMLSSSSKNEIAKVPECPVILASTLRETVGLLGRKLSFSRVRSLTKPKPATTDFLIDKVRGQEEAKRCLEIALAGGHHLLMTGPPGVGKTMLAKSAIQLLPRLDRREALQLASVYSLVGEEYELEKSEPPMRSPHHSCSRTTLIGGGTQGYPGELALADRGILFLDEISEIGRVALESLRQPMQDGFIRLNRRGVEMVHQTRGMVLAARNPCACGLLNVEGQSCRCSAVDLERYERKLSESLLDRFDLFCSVSNSVGQDVESDIKYSGKEITERIDKARKRQAKRYGLGQLNSRAGDSEIKPYVDMSKLANDYLQRASESFYLSERGIQKVLAVCRTIADLDGLEQPTLEHLQEAISYRHRRLVN